MTYNRRTIALLLTSITLVGCGGGEVTPPVAPPSSPPPPVAGPKPVPAARPAPAAQAQRPQQKKKESSTEIDLAGKTTQDFLIATTAPGNAAITKPDEAGRVALFATPENKSNTLIVIPPAQENPRSTQRRVQLSIELPEGLMADELAGVTEEGLPERILRGPSQVPMVLIPGGVFTQGSDSGPDDVGPAHAAFVGDFYIDETEVTVAQYNVFEREAEEAKIRLSRQEPSNLNGDSDEPIIGVNWRGASEFAEFYKVQLPTEAQWEKAGRTDQSFAFPWGRSRPIWEKPRSLGQITPVKTYQGDVSAYGVFDMAGNAREWTNDWYAAKAYDEALEADGSPKRDWTGPARADIAAHRVLKGGSDGWELWRRSHASMREHLKDVGFRCVLNLTKEMRGEE